MRFLILASSFLGLVVVVLIFGRGADNRIFIGAPAGAAQRPDGNLADSVSIATPEPVTGRSSDNGGEANVTAGGGAAAIPATEAVLGSIQITWTAPGTDPVELVSEYDRSSIELIPLGNTGCGVRVMRLPVGSWRFMLRGQSCATVAKSVELRYDELVYVNLDATAIQTVRIQVLSALDGLPVAGAKLTLLDDLLAQSVTTDPSGMADLPGLTRPREGSNTWMSRLVKVLAPGFADECSFLMCSPSDPWWSLAVQELPAWIEEQRGGIRPAISMALRERGPNPPQGFPTVHGSAESTRLYIWPSRTITGLLPWLSATEQASSRPASLVRCRGMVPTGLVTLDQVQIAPEADQAGVYRLRGLHPLGAYCLELRSADQVMVPLCLEPGFGDVDLGLPELGPGARVRGRLDKGAGTNPVLRGRPCSCSLFKLALDDQPLPIDEKGYLDLRDLTPCDNQIMVTEVDLRGDSVERVLSAFQLEPGQIHDLGLLTATR